MLKSFFIGVMAISGMALAQTIDLTPLTGTLGIGHQNTQKTIDPVQDATAGTLVFTNGDWSRGYASYSLPETVTLSNTDSVLNLTFDMTTTNTNSCQTVTLIGNGTSLTVGSGNYSSGIQMGTTDSTELATFYQMQGASTGGVYVAPTATKTDMVTANTPVSMSVNIAWDAVSAAYVATVKAGETTIGTADLGADYTLSALVMSQDGSSVQTLSNMHLTPEPATATLSLLALAGLAARRRRK